jgi:hypothetical protein
MKPVKKKKRLQLDCSDRTVARLDSILERTGASSRAEVIRRALELYGCCIALRDNGAEIVLREENGTECGLLLLEGATLGEPPQRS